MISALHGAIVNKNLVVVFKYGNRLPGLMIGDRFRVEHVISNLLSNAIKFSPDEKEIVIDITGVVRQAGAQPDVDVSHADNNHRSSSQRKVPSGNSFLPARMSGLSSKHHPAAMDVTIAITDAGPGISSANQAKLFNNFVQIRPQALQMGQGSGLGLALCKAIVELHNGTIGVRQPSIHVPGLIDNHYLSLLTTLDLSVTYFLITPGGVYRRGRINVLLHDPFRFMRQRAKRNIIEESI